MFLRLSFGYPPQDADGCPVNIMVIPNGDGTFRCSYVPTKPIKHTIIISWGGVNVPKSPFRVCPPVLPPCCLGSQREGGAPYRRCWSSLGPCLHSPPQNPQRG